MLVEAAASSTLLDAIKIALDRTAETEIRWNRTSPDASSVQPRRTPP